MELLIVFATIFVIVAIILFMVALNYEKSIYYLCQVLDEDLQNDIVELSSDPDIENIDSLKNEAISEYNKRKMELENAGEEGKKANLAKLDKKIIEINKKYEENSLKFAENEELLGKLEEENSRLIEEETKKITDSNYEIDMAVYEDNKEIYDDLLEDIEFYDKLKPMVKSIKMVSKIILKVQKNNA